MKQIPHSQKTRRIIIPFFIGICCLANLGCDAGKYDPTWRNTAIHTQSFRFTVTSDQRECHDTFADTLQAIKDIAGGPGAFHLSCGDIDKTIADNRAVIDAQFGADFLWYTPVGNHEAETEEDMAWLRDEYSHGNGMRTPLKRFTNQDGPPGAYETCYTWDYGPARFILLNEYWNGSTAPGSDCETDGNIVDPLYDWLAKKLRETRRSLIFVIGHEPAFPYRRHIGDSLDQYPQNRDRFWALLEKHHVFAYLAGHIHYYYKHQGDKNNEGHVWQLVPGTCQEIDKFDGQTFFDITVDRQMVQVDVWQNTGMGFSRIDTIRKENASVCEMKVHSLTP